MSTTLEVLCDHAEITQYANKKGVVLFECCSNCGLPPKTPVLAAYPGEMLPWWDHKPAAKEAIDANRPGINLWHDWTAKMKEQEELLTELLAWERELGEPQTEALVAELAKVVSRHGWWYQ